MKGKSRFDRGGDFPNRPQHDDFWTLSSIVLALDGMTQGRSKEEVDAAIMAHLQIDKHSVFYMAEQRAMRALEHGGPAVVFGVSTFLDGFAVGIDWGKKLAAKEAEGA